MKRPPGLWLLLTIVAVWLKVQDVYSLKATALIFGKTTTTTTTITPVPDASEEASAEGVTEGSSPEQNSTKPQLTGIPQIDYIWDPNLPRELNGYNLSEYPFYHRVPEDIKFKCDGLHDGFYASVPHKCQVYHHCLFGVRYDFLCANYTAFDQKTFICHFVSEVDCLNSKKFWHRNDALYQAASTTTPKPPPVQTLPPPPASTVPIVPILSRRPDRPRRPPLRRARPYDYYDQEYEDEEYYEKPVRRQRPRYRPRVYDDEYDYEEEDYVRRPGSRRNENRRPYKSRGSNRRRPYDDEEYDDEDSRRSDSSRKNSDETRRPPKRRPSDDDDYDRRTYERPRKKGYRRPIDEEYEDDLPPRRSSDRRKNINRDESRKYDDEDEEERPRNNNRDDRPRKNYDRNRNEDSIADDKPRNKNERERNGSEESSSDDRLGRNNERNKNDEYDDRQVAKPATSIYDRKRPVLKVRPPVPAHEQARYSPKVPKTTTPEPIADEEYYDVLEEDANKKEETRTHYTKNGGQKITTTTQSSSKREYDSKKKQEDYEDELETTTRRHNKRPKFGDEGFGNKDRRYYSISRKRPVLEEEYDDYDENQKISTTTTSTTKEPLREAIVKVVKRPFLPSRGGSPYASRGLLPVGSKSVDTSNAEHVQETQNSKSQEEKSETDTEEDKPKSTPIVVKIPVNRNKHTYDEEFKPISNRPVTRIIKITSNATTTESPKPAEKNPLDLDENEYDVTLNDALNPTLPNLPVRNFPTGFSSQNDYTYNALQRPRYVVDPVINQASSDYIYRVEQPEAVSNNIRYKTVPLFTNLRQTPRVTQAIYSSY